MPILALAFKAFISNMKSPKDLPNVNLWIVYCWEYVFVVRQICVCWFQRWYQFKYWVLNICSGIGIRSIYIINEVTGRIIKRWHQFSLLLLIFLYWERSCMKSCLYLHVILFEVIIILITSHNHFIICYALKKHWFAWCCFI